MVNEALAADKVLKEKGIGCEIIKVSRLDSIPIPMVMDSLKKTGRLIVSEESCSAGCFGEHILAMAQQEKIVLKNAELLNLGNGIVTHGTVEELRALYGIDGTGIAKTAVSMFDFAEK